MLSAYRTNVLSSSVGHLLLFEDCQESWLDEIMGHSWFKWY